MKGKDSVRLALRVLGLNFRAAAEYRVNFIVQVFGMMLNNAAFAAFWGVLTARAGNLGGYTFADIMTIWALVSSSFGLAHVVAGNARDLGGIIQRGDLDVYLLQPRDPFVSAITSRTEVSAVGDLAYGYLVMFMLPGLDPWKLAVFTALTVSGALVFTGTFAMVESLAFWLGSSEGISSTLTEFLITFSLYPETIFPAPMRWLMFSLVPSGFIAFVPLAAVSRMDPVSLCVALGAGIAYFALGAAVFRLGLRRYESGNRMGARI